MTRQEASMDYYIYKHIKHSDRKCPRIVNIDDAMIRNHAKDDVYETCRVCEKKAKALP
jgi:hypothetical protein